MESHVDFYLKSGFLGDLWHDQYKNRVSTIKENEDEDMRESNVLKNVMFQLSGWVLFLFCAVLFIISSSQHGDMIMFFGSVTFFLACIPFIIPLVKVVLKKDEMSGSQK